MNDLVYKIGDCVKTTGLYYSNMLGVIIDSTEFYRVQMIYNLNSNDTLDLNEHTELYFLNNFRLEF